jgi:hypothetical protein
MQTEAKAPEAGLETDLLITQMMGIRLCENWFEVEEAEESNKDDTVAYVDEYGVLELWSGSDSRQFRPSTNDADAFELVDYVGRTAFRLHRTTDSLRSAYFGLSGGVIGQGPTGRASTPALAICCAALLWKESQV